VDKTWQCLWLALGLPTVTGKGRPAWQKSIWIHSALKNAPHARQRHRQKAR
jgi:hypothetical protein